MERRVKLECSCVAQAKVIYGRFHPFISILYFHGVASQRELHLLLLLFSILLPLLMLLMVYVSVCA